jgi:steroid delta-isomerase-like uncharacterized protein
MKLYSYFACALMILGSTACASTTPAGQDPTSKVSESQKALIRRFYQEVWNEGKMPVIEQVFASQYTRHDPGAGTHMASHEDQRKSAGAQRAMFPDLELHIDFMIAEGDKVAARWTIRGTNLGPRGKNLPTGKSVKFSGINIFRFEDGKVVELWNHRDDLSLFRQLDDPRATP